MLNTVHLDGFVTRKRWQIGPDLYFRLAVYRDPDRPRKEAENGKVGKDEPDYITVRLPNGVASLTGRLKAGQRVQVHGWLESRHYEESLEEILEKAGLSPNEIGDQAKVAVRRTTTWVCADRVVVVPNGKGS